MGQWGAGCRLAAAAAAQAESSTAAAAVTNPGFRGRQQRAQDAWQQQPQPEHRAICFPGHTGATRCHCPCGAALSCCSGPALASTAAAAGAAAAAASPPPKDAATAAASKQALQPRMQTGASAVPAAEACPGCGSGPLCSIFWRQQQPEH